MNISKLDSDKHHQNTAQTYLLIHFHEIIAFCQRFRRVVCKCKLHIYFLPSEISILTFRCWVNHYITLWELMKPASTMNSNRMKILRTGEKVSIRCQRLSKSVSGNNFFGALMQREFNWYLNINRNNSVLLYNKCCLWIFLKKIRLFPLVHTFFKWFFRKLQSYRSISQTKFPHIKNLMFCCIHVFYLITEHHASTSTNQLCFTG